MKRRTFLQQSLAAAGSISLTGFPADVLAAPQKKFASDVVTLGNTGIKVSRLAMGTGTSGIGGSSNQTRKLGVDGLADLLEAAYDNGINFWESADQYGSHPHLKEGLKRVPRDKVVILTKTHASSAKEMRSDLERFKKELGTDYIDIILLHCMTSANWPSYKAGAMEELSRARENGEIGAHGVSCHDFGALKTAAETDWVQVDLARINPFEVRMDDGVSEVSAVLKDMKAKGKGVIGMKIFGAGRLRGDVDECLQFTLSRKFIDCFTIGQESYAQMQDLITRIPKASVKG